MAGLAGAAAELEALAFRLRRAGDTDLLRELTAAMRRGAESAEGPVRADLKPRLPDRYAATLDADLRIGTNVRTSDRDPGVTLTGKSGQGRKLRNLDAGRLTHPVYGNREVWRSQEEPSVQPGWFTGPAADAAPRIRRELEQALEDVAAKAVKGA